MIASGKISGIAQDGTGPDRIAGNVDDAADADVAVYTLTTTVSSIGKNDKNAHDMTFVAKKEGGTHLT